MKSILKILLLSSLAMLMAFSCEKGKQVLPDQQDPERYFTTYQAQGKIIANFTWCYGYWVMIEVENPLGIGDSGSFKPIMGQEFKYKNAIGVPYFKSLPDLMTDAPDSVGTWLNFEYRELTDKEWNSQIFVDTSYNYICPANIVPPRAKMYIVTKIIDYH
ncbi:MAG: hypothetical protein IH595_03415 [Bacteroidales bacterium]|nr:hypothetical protein [Bacteroidales bacterium]